MCDFWRNSRHVPQKKQQDNAVISNSRLIWFVPKKDRSEPLQDQQHFLHGQSSEMVRQERQPRKEYEGAMDLGNQVVTNIWMGTNEAIHNAIGRYDDPNRPAEEKVMDLRVQHALRSSVAREMSLERQRRGTLGKIALKGWSGLRSIIGIFRENGDAVGRRMEELYGLQNPAAGVLGTVRNFVGGPNLQHEAIRLRLANDVLAPLNAAQQLQIQMYLIALGVVFPAGAPAGVNPQALQLSNATAHQLRQLRANVMNPGGGLIFQQPPIGLVDPTMPPEPPATPLDRLIEMRSVELEERRDQNMTMVYDHRRLQQVLERLRVIPLPPGAAPNTTIRELIDQILVDDSFYTIENSVDASALIKYLEEYAENRNDPAQPNFNRTPERLREVLMLIRGRLAPVVETRQAGQEPSPELQQVERIQELTRNVAEMHRNLSKLYTDADTSGANLYNLRRTLAGLPPPAAVPGGGVIDTGYRETVAQINATDKEKTRLQAEINNLEKNYRQTRNELVVTLTGQTPANPVPNFVTYQAVAFAPGESTEEQLFGQTEPVIPLVAGPRPPRGGPNPFSDFQVHLNTFTNTQMSNMTREINNEFIPLFRKREKITTRQLLFMLNETDFERRGNTNPESRKINAFKTMLEQVDEAEHGIRLARAENREHSERLGAETLGSRRLNRFKKWFLANFAKRNVYKAQDVITYVSGFDKSLYVFKDLPPDATLSEARDFIAKNKIPEAKLKEFEEKLTQILESFELLNDGGKVELYDKDVKSMRSIIKNLQIVKRELRTGRYAETVRGMEGDRNALFLQRILDDQQADRNEVRGILELLGNNASEMAEWKREFAKDVLKDKYFDKLKQAYQYIKANNMKGKKAQDYLSSEGLMTAASVLSSAVQAYETYDMTKRVAGSAWGKIRGGTGFVYEGGANVVNKLWNRGLKPLGETFIVDPIKYVYRAPGRVLNWVSSKLRGSWWKSNPPDAPTSS